jgi:hypothetical protein
MHSLINRTKYLQTSAQNREPLTSEEHNLLGCNAMKFGSSQRYSTKTSAGFYQTTRRYNPQGHALNNHCCQNLQLNLKKWFSMSHIGYKDSCTYSNNF